MPHAVIAFGAGARTRLGDMKSAPCAMQLELQLQHPIIARHTSALWPPQPYSVNDTAGRAYALQEAGDREVASVQRFFEVTLLNATRAAFVVVGANNIRTISSASRRLLTSVLSLGHPKVSRGVTIVEARSHGLQLLIRVSVALVFVLFNVFGLSIMCAMAQAFQNRFNTCASPCISRRR
jgi:hypothetical protein